MLLNYFVLVAALAAGIVSGGAAVRWIRDGQPSSTVVVGAAALGATVTFVAGIGALFITGLSVFTLIHVVYVVLTVGVPVAGGLVLVLARSRPRFVTVVCVLCLLGAPVGVYATHIEPFWLKVETVKLAVDGIEEPIRVGVLSDLQTPEIGDYENHAVDRLLSYAPDIVVLPGDLYQLEARLLDQRAPQFARLIQRLVDEVPFVYLVSGNTDTVAGLQQITRHSGAKVLDDETEVVELKGSTLRIGGTTLFGDETAANSMAQRLSGDQRSDVRLLLAHKPDGIRLLPYGGADLVIAGHTHGGQVAIPLLGPIITLSSVPRHVAAGGLHELRGIPIYVSTGVGRERGHAPQLRFGARPSIGIIDLVSPPPGA